MSPRSAFPLMCAAVLLSGRGPAENVIILGDSLSKEYAIEFLGIGGNFTASHIRNWNEILDARRAAWFSFGGFGAYKDWRITGHDYNWSIPGSYAADWRENLTPPDDAPVELESQIRHNVHRAVVWLGGNEIRERYGDFYNGKPFAAWVDQVASDIIYVVDYVLGLNPSLPMVLVSVPHVGSTPKKEEEFPFDAVKTGRVTAAMDALNLRLQQAAAARGIGYCDTYTMTRELLTRTYWPVGGWRLQKTASSGGHSDALFLGDGFHPNWPTQAVFAQMILDAFNAQYRTRIPRLTNYEIVNDVLEEDADLTLSQWTNGCGIVSGDRGFADDPDKDRVKNIVEFALDLDPLHADTALLPQPYLTTSGSQTFLNLSWQPRDPDNSDFVRITPQESTDFVTWTDIPQAAIISGGHNVKSVRRSLNSGQRLHLRLKATQL